MGHLKFKGQREVEASRTEGRDLDTPENALGRNSLARDPGDRTTVGSREVSRENRCKCIEDSLENKD